MTSFQSSWALATEWWHLVFEEEESLLPSEFRVTISFH
jgi:hypothetical protein